MIQMSSRSSYSEMCSIAIHGDYLYSGVNATTGRMSTYNATDPTALGVGVNFIDSKVVDGAVTDIATYGHLIYFTAYDSTSDRSLRVLDAGDPDNTLLITNQWANKKAYGLDISGQLAYVAAADEGFYVLNISDKHQAVEYDYLPLPGFISDVVVDGRFAYIAAGEAGVHVVDVFNPHNLVWAGTIDTDGFARKLVKQGNTIYVACLDGGLFTLDVADPYNPSYVTKMVFGADNVWDVDTFGNYVFVARDSGVTSILASSDGGGLIDFGTNAYQSTFSDLEAYDVQVKGDIAFVAGGPDGFYTLNVKDPYNPVLLDQATIGSGIYKNLDVEGQYAYLMNETVVAIYDVSDPANILLVNQMAGSGLNDVELVMQCMEIM